MVLLTVSPAYGQVALTTSDDAASTVGALKAAAPAAPKVEAPKAAVPTAAAPAPPKAEAPKMEAPKPAAPAPTKVEAPKLRMAKVRAPKVRAPKVKTAKADETVGREAAGIAGRGAKLQAAVTQPVERARDRLGAAASKTTGAVTSLAEEQQLGQTVAASVEETRRTVDAVLGSGGGDLFGGGRTGGLLAGVVETLALLTRDAFPLLALERSEQESVSAFGSGPTFGGSGEAGLPAAQGADPTALSVIAGGSAGTSVAASTSGGGVPPAAGGPAGGRFDFRALEIAPWSLWALLGGAGPAGSAAPTPPAGPERGPGQTDVPALGASAGQAFAFTALLAILSLFVFAARGRGRVFRVPNAWCRAPGFSSLIELPG